MNFDDNNNDIFGQQNNTTAPTEVVTPPAPTSPVTNNSNQERNSPQQQQQPAAAPFDLKALNETRERLWSILESQAGVMSFILYVLFALIVTGSTNWMVSFACFAVACRMVLHGVVVILAFKYSDIVVSALGIIIIAICLPFTKDTAAAGVWSYLLLILPFYSEQALKNQAMNQALDLNQLAISMYSGQNLNLWRKRAVEIIQVFAPIAAGFYPFFSLQGGFFFHLIYIVVALVYTASIVLRALEMKKMGDSASSSSNNENNNNNNDDTNNNNNNVQVLDGGIVISPSRNNNADGEGASGDAASQFVSDLQRRKNEFESNLSQNNPQVYKYYLHLPRSYTTAVCTFLIFLMIVINVSTYTPLPSNAMGNNSTAQNGTAASSSSPGQETAAPVPTRNEGGSHTNVKTKTSANARLYSDHYYITIGLVSAFLMASIERLVDAFLPKSNEPNEVNNNSNSNKKKQQERTVADEMNEASSSTNNNEADGDDEKCCETPSIFNTIAQNLRYRRFVLLGFSFVISFFPVSWKLYPAALAMASYVPWLVWRDSCGKFISTLLLSENDNNNSTTGMNQGSTENDRQVPGHEHEANTNTNNNNQSPSPSSFNNLGTKIEELISERVVADFLLPTIVTALLLLLATGAEDKDPNNFLSFIAIAAHGAMAYFLYFSMKENLSKNDEEQARRRREENARDEAAFAHL